MLIGVKSTALKFGDKTKHWLTGFGTIMIGGLTLTGVALDQTWPYYTGVSITAAHLAYQVSYVNNSSRSEIKRWAIPYKVTYGSPLNNSSDTIF